MIAPPTIHRYVDVDRTDALLGGIDDVFFGASATREFESNEDRNKFRERWLGRYLRHFPELAFVAMHDDAVTGYLVGADIDPSRSALFSDVDYFAKFAALTPAFPGHLHVNVADRARGQGLGSRLIGVFLDALRIRGTPGVHVVTSRGGRNVAFYLRNGFAQRGASGIGSTKELVFLGRSLLSR